MAQIECAAKCGVKAFQREDAAQLPIPPVGWLTIGIDKGIDSAPFQETISKYNAVVCSIECGIRFLEHKEHMVKFFATPKKFQPLFDDVDVMETRSEIAARIGFAVLEAVDDFDAGLTVLLPLSGEKNERLQTICVALMPMNAELKEMTKNATEFTS